MLWPCRARAMPTPCPCYAHAVPMAPRTTQARARTLLQLPLLEGCELADIHALAHAARGASCPPRCAPPRARRARSPAPRPQPRPAPPTHRAPHACAPGGGAASAVTAAWRVLCRATIIGEGEACEGLVVLVAGRARVCVQLAPEGSEREGEGGEGGEEAGDQGGEQGAEQVVLAHLCGVETMGLIDWLHGLVECGRCASPTLAASYGLPAAHLAATSRLAATAHLAAHVLHSSYKAGVTAP